MPTYDYECRTCGFRFEVFHNMSDESRHACPECGGESKRVPAAGAGLLFKGSGFYITDYRSPSYTEKAKQESSSSTPAADAKPAGEASSTSGAPGGTGSSTPVDAPSPKPPKKTKSPDP